MNKQDQNLIELQTPLTSLELAELCSVVGMPARRLAFELEGLRAKVKELEVALRTTRWLG